MTQRTLQRLVVASTLALLITSAIGAPVAAAPPSNDAITAPRVVTALPYSDGPYSTLEATTAAGDPGFCHDPSFGPDRATVWYSFTPTVADDYLATTFGSTYDTTLYVGTSNGAGGIDVIGCVDDVNGLQSAVAWSGQAGVTYLIAVGTCCGGGTPGGTGGGGNLVFGVQVAPPAPTLDLVVSSTADVTKYGLVTIRGTVTCSNADGAIVDLQASQTHGRFIFRGFGFAEGLACDGTPQAWTIEVSSQDRRFIGGKITVDAFSSACGLVFCADEFIAQMTVRLRR